MHSWSMLLHALHENEMNLRIGGEIDLRIIARAKCFRMTKRTRCTLYYDGSGMGIDLKLNAFPILIPESHTHAGRQRLGETDVTRSRQLLSEGFPGGEGKESRCKMEMGTGGY